MGMLQNLTKQMEGMDDGDDADKEPTEDEMKECEKMLQGIFGQMGGPNPFFPPE